MIFAILGLNPDQKSSSVIAIFFPAPRNTTNTNIVASNPHVATYRNPFTNSGTVPSDTIHTIEQTEKIMLTIRAIKFYK